jgi:gliding motility-associated-like protein
LKFRLIIFALFCQIVVSAQVGPPALRCLQVINTSGDLKLTWIPPTDPQSQFFGYEIFYANNKLGPYASITPTAGPVSASNFVLTTTVTTVQSLFVFVRSHFGAAGVNSSASSDTLKSIFLNINTSIVETYALSFNDLHSPKLSTSSPTMSVWQEYPTGVWKNLANTDLYKYNDTLSVCNSQSLTINYSVTMTDNSGCVSNSNVQGGKYHDKHNPYTIYADSISVLPNGNTILAWTLPYEKDVANYQIQQQNANGQNQNIATVNGYSTTNFILANAAAASGTVGIYVQGIDSCGNGGAFVDYEPATMYLKTFYNYCTFETQLDWTPYKWAKVNGSPLNEVLEYRVYMSEDSGATFKRIASTTGLSYRHTQVNTAKKMMYFVRVINKRKTMTASSNRSSFYSGQVFAPSFVYIKAASVIKKNSIEIRSHVDNKQAFKRLIIDRSKDGIKFDTIGSQAYLGLSNYSFEDKNADTENRIYYYRIRVVDSCGNIRLISNVCKTILLKVREDQDNYFQRILTWTPYEGFDAGVKNYEIYRAINDVHEVDLIGRMDSAGTFTDNLEFAAPLGAVIEYYVKAIEDYGNQYAIQEFSSSNFAQALMEGRIFVPNAFAPNGHNRTWKPIVQFVENREYNVTVFNKWGQVVFETSDENESWNGDKCPNDVYSYIVSYRTSFGEYRQVTGHVMLIR